MQTQGVRPHQSKALTFEFTKRKRWADLLVTELTEAITLILNSQCQILYCGAAVNELLGWRDEELVDGDFIELINVADKTNFRKGFVESIRTRSDMLSYARLHCKNDYITHSDYPIQPKEVLFEIKGYPHFIEGDMECKCFFATAKPYPSRNTAMQALSTFLELKMENERLQHRLLELRTETPWVGGSSSSAKGPPGHVLHYASGPSSAGSAVSTRTSMGNSMHMTPGLNSGSELSEALYSLQDIIPGPAIRSYDTAGLRTVDDDGTGEPARKKQKKVFSSEQHVCVTCGRTDSPEWRKGPLGPKTLCNACGLRWAKKMRKSDDHGEGGASQEFNQSV